MLIVLIIAKQDRMRLQLEPFRKIMNTYLTNWKVVRHNVGFDNPLKNISPIIFMICL